MNFKKHIKTGSAILFGLSCMSVSADVWQERELLKRYSTQLKNLDTLLMQAKIASDTDRRVEFDYTAMHRDVNSIRDKINHYLNTPLEPYSSDSTKRVGE